MAVQYLRPDSLLVHKSSRLRVDASAYKPTALSYPILSEVDRLVNRNLCLQDQSTQVASLSRPERKPLSAQVTFFEDFAGELRNKIYGYLVEDLVVRIDASRLGLRGFGERSSVHMFRAVKNADKAHKSNSGNKRKRYEPSALNFMCISRQFYNEIREVLYQNVTVLFSRRWDFLTACGTQSLYLHELPTAHNEDILLFPRSPSVFTKIRRLYINLSQSNDFGGTIYTVEAERVTALILKMISQNLPELQTLAFCVNVHSRLSLVEGVFLPEPGFIEALLAVKQIKSLHMAPGPGWRGNGPRQKIFQANLDAFELLMHRHYTGVSVIQQGDLAGDNRWERLLKIARLIVAAFDAAADKPSTTYVNATDLLRAKIIAIESGVQR